MSRVSLLLFSLSSATLFTVAPSLAASVSANASAEGPLSFDEARVIFHDKSDIFRADNARIAHAQKEAEAAKSLNGPRVDLTFKQVWGTKEIHFDAGDQLSGVGDALGKGLTQLPPAIAQGLAPALSGLSSQLSQLSFDVKQKLDGPRLSIDAMWPIYTGGLISAEQTALHEKVNETTAERDMRLNTMDAELVAKYWGLQLARSIEALRTSSLQDQEDELHKAKRFEQKGVISKLERLSVQVARDSAKRELQKAQTNTEVATAQLANALRKPTVAELSTPLFVLTGDLGTLSMWQNRAQANSPLLRRLTALRAQADQGVKAASAAFKPKVFAFGSRNLIKHYLSLVEPDWIAGVGVTFTLWSDRDRSSKYAAANELVNSAVAARDEVSNQLSTAVETAFLHAVQARDEYVSTASNVELATENLRLRTKAFSEGLSTANDVDIARTQLLATELSRRVAAYEFIVSWALLHATSGVMEDFYASLKRPDFSAVH